MTRYCKEAANQPNVFSSQAAMPNLWRSLRLRTDRPPQLLR